jgi:mono/diheme cytochrome c family protein
MTTETSPSLPMAPEAVPAQPEQKTAPVWLMILGLMLCFGSLMYFDQHSGWFRAEVYAPYRTYAELIEYQPLREGPDVRHGQEVYEKVCALCHNTDGKGKPNQAPPFVGSEFVLGNPNRLIHIPLLGLTGPVTVNGDPWNLSMPNMGASLSDDDLAAVLTYMRMSWGNKASVISSEQVKAVRSSVGNRSQQMTVPELQNIN